MSVPSRITEVVVLWATASLVLAAIALATHIAYNLLFHPLRSFPGPKLWAATRIPWNRANLAGRLAWTLRDTHAAYGPVVRIGPDELSFMATGSDVWKAIYARRPDEMPKALTGHGLPPPANGIHGIITADQQNHSRIRRAIAPAFSESALREQQPFFDEYIAKLVALLRQRAETGPQDLAVLYNWATFDIIGDLAFGESFGGLDGARTHPWVGMILGHVKAIAFLQFALYYRLTGLMQRLASKKSIEARRRFTRFVRDKVTARLEKGKDERRDLVTYILEGTDASDRLSELELQTTSMNLIVAGSETSATLLSGLTYYMLHNHAIYEKLASEIRSSFASPRDINASSVSRLSYLAMVIQEALRMYPPAPAAIPRIVPNGGDMIAGRWVAGGTVVGVHQLSTNYSELNFKDPKKFVPERWDKKGSRPNEYDNDRRDAMQPFSYGPRGCLGINFANLEIRLILCHLLMNFDLELSEESKDWPRQSVYLIWEKKPLMVNLQYRL